MQVFRNSVNGSARPECVFTETDEEYHVGLIKSHDKRLIMIQSSASMQNEIRYVHTDKPCSDFKVRISCIQRVGWAAVMCHSMSCPAAIESGGFRPGNMWLMRNPCIILPRHQVLAAPLDLVHHTAIEG